MSDAPVKKLRVDPNLPIYTSTKTYDPGFSCAFRQHLASHSHCSLLHGYALAIRIEFSTQELDSHNWCIDFGGLKLLKEQLTHWFDHTTCVASDDPLLDELRWLESVGLANIRVFPGGVGCERFAEFVHVLTTDFLLSIAEANRVWVSRVEVKEHGGNSAIFMPPALVIAER